MPVSNYFSSDSSFQHSRSNTVVVMTSYGNECLRQQNMQCAPKKSVKSDDGFHGRYKVFAAKGHIPGGSLV